MRLFIWFLVFFLIITVGIGSYFTWATQNSSEQAIFLKGDTPQELPNGYYFGYASSYSGSWRGKTFDQERGTGVNIYRSDLAGVEEVRYPFKMSTGRGLRDPQLTVIKLDYDVSDNPFWRQYFLEEIVEVDEGEFIGKVHIRLIPYFPFSVDFFRLSLARETN